MKTSNPIEVMVDVTRNRIKLSFCGVVGRADIERYEDEIARALTSLQPGFTLVSDLTDLTLMDIDCVPAVERTMDVMRKHGIQFAIRIIPDPAKDIGMNIISLFHYPRGMKIITTQTREEAAHALGE